MTYRSWLCSLLILMFSCKVEAHTPALHIKVEAPIVEKAGGKEVKLQNQRFNKTLYDGLAPSFGVGYIPSEFFSVELMYSTRPYNLMAYGINGTLIASGPISFSSVSSLANEYFTTAWHATQKVHAMCIDTPHLYYTAAEICSATTNVFFPTSNTIVTNISGNLQTLVLSGKVKPFGEVSIFSPYISLGAGIAYSRSKYSSFYYDSDVLSSSVTGTKKTSGIALEGGIGSEIRLADNVSLDFAARYFDYGKHAMAPNISRKISGYKVTAGAMLKFPVKNISPSLYKMHDNVVDNNKVPRIYDNSSMYNEAEKSFARKQGIAEGEMNATINIAKKMLKLGMDKSNIAIITGLSVDDLNGICKIKPPASPQ